MDNLINSPLDAELSKLSPFELKGRIIAAADEKVKTQHTHFSMPAAATRTGLPSNAGKHSSPSACSLSKKPNVISIFPKASPVFPGKKAYPCASKTGCGLTPANPA